MSDTIDNSPEGQALVLQHIEDELRALEAPAEERLRRIRSLEAHTPNLPPFVFPDVAGEHRCDRVLRMQREIAAWLPKVERAMGPFFTAAVVNSVVNLAEQLR